DAIAARLALADADAAKAAELADGAFATLLEPDDMRVRERNWLTLVQAEIASGRLRDASARVDRVETLRDASPTPAARLYASLVSAELARAQRNDAAARVAFESAQAEAESDRVPLDIVTAAEAYAGWLIETGDLAAASAVVERVAPWTTQSYRASLLPVRLYHAAGLASAWSAALDRAQRLAGERHVPDAIASPPR
ncbi:MAG TPA: hypothetical protein VJ696_14600, partial [Rhodanobacteraceae bacterium]|nr:hypothetical protein [Rhodanobacteraceae bacterium]